MKDISSENFFQNDDSKETKITKILTENSKENINYKILNNVKTLLPKLEFSNNEVKKYCSNKLNINNDEICIKKIGIKKKENEYSLYLSQFNKNLNELIIEEDENKEEEISSCSLLQEEFKNKNNLIEKIPLEKINGSVLKKGFILIKEKFNLITLI